MSWDRWNSCRWNSVGKRVPLSLCLRKECGFESRRRHIENLILRNSLSLLYLFNGKIKVRIFYSGKQNGSVFSSRFFSYDHNDDSFCYNKSLFYGVQEEWYIISEIYFFIKCFNYARLFSIMGVTIWLWKNIGLY